MKNFRSLFMLVSAIFAVMPLFAQEAAERLSEAQSAYKSGNLQDTKFALQQALNEVDKAIGAEILKLFPQKIGNMSADQGSDSFTGSGMGFAGLYVSRNYSSGDDKSAALQIIGDSPFLAGINAILALPSFMSDPSQKRIKVGNYRALLKKNTSDEGTSSWDVQIPFGSSLMTFNCKGVADEKTVTDMVNTIPLDKIARWLQ